ncbi:hypothetical protein EYR40_006054 [Pleurotus pulmonarius]|nr:hypothetical protein EYR36_005566 [Pleurotus pulmonarius]KAF4602836.1 hypothetical protein EYR40_006054 [Pleurotus pulmonarius]
MLGIDADVLLNLLEPFEETSSLWPFGISNAEAWARFDEYAWRVRVLSFPPDVDYPYTIFDQVLNIKFERNRPLVPNLMAVSIAIEPDLVHRIINLFGHSSVRKLTLEPYIFDDFWGCSEPLEVALSIFESPLINMPSLRTFIISSSEFDIEDEESRVLVQAFASIVGKFDRLEEVQIPAFWLTDPVLDSLASLPCLQSLEIQMCDAPCPAQFTTIPAIINNYFPSLDKLVMNTSISQALVWSSHPGLPKTLTSLCIHSDEDERVDVWARLLEVIGSQLRHLRTLILEQDLNGYFIVPHVAPLSLDLRHLLSLSELRDVSLDLGHDMIINPNELIALFKALPRLEHLKIPRSTAVDISCLAEIAPIAQRLETLELNWHTPENLAALPRVHIPFSQLRFIHGDLRCGLPPIPVAVFLEDVLPPECTIPKTWGTVRGVPNKEASVYDVREAFSRARQKDRRRRGRAWAYIGPVGMGAQA